MVIVDKNKEVLRPSIIWCDSRAVEIGNDTFARALLIADKIITSSPYEKLRKERYSSFDSGKGKDFETGKLKLSDLYNIAKENGELQLKSGKQELFENIINQYI